MNASNIIKKIAITLVLFGAINWLVVGFVSFDAVASVFGGDSAVSVGQSQIVPRIIYVIIGIAGVYVAFLDFRGKDTGLE